MVHLRDLHGLIILLVLYQISCGARTGLLGESRDAGPEPDVPDIPVTDFPCRYGQSGEPEVLGTDEQATTSPNTLWFEERLDVVYKIMSSEPLAPFAEIGLCSADTSLGLACVERFDIAGPTLSPVLIAHGREGFAVCWTADFSGRPSMTSLTLLNARRDPIVDIPLEENGAPFLGLAWDGDRFLAALGQARGGAGIEVWSFNPSGALGLELEMELASPLGASPDASLDATDQLAAVAWVEGRQLHLRGLSGTGFDEVTVARDIPGPVSISIRDDQIGLLWPESSMGSESVAIRFALVDGASGLVHHQTEVISFTGEFRALELEALWDGFMVGLWRVEGRNALLGVTPMHFNEDDTMRVSTEILINEQAATGSWGLSLTDDGHVAFVAASYPEETTGIEQVHLHLLSCHR